MPRFVRNARAALVSLCLGLATVAAAEGLPSPWMTALPAGQPNEIDAIVSKALAASGRTLLPSVPDELFLRRVHLDLLGTPPTVAEQDAFLADTAPDKRARLVEALFSRPEFADYLALKWGDILRIKSEYPSNLWPNAVQAYHQWIREAMRTNLPYDRFARELLTASGSNVREPQVNFFRAMPVRDPESIAKAVAVTFLGRRLESFAPAGVEDFKRFFARLSYKRTMEWKEEIVHFNPLGPGFPASGETANVAYRFPDGSAIEAPAALDPRALFADWLVAPGNPFFARTAANRVWAWLMGSGIYRPVDGGGPGNPGDCPELLDLLARRLVESGYDLRALFRLVLLSRCYAQTALGPAEPAFARYAVRRLDAEVLADALGRAAGAGGRYVSPIPEPFTFVPEENRSIALPDGSVTSAFLVKFGRPARDSGLEAERNNEVGVDQKLYLLNSTALRQRIDRGPLLAEVLERAKTDGDGALRHLYRSLLGRAPTAAERETAKAHLRKKAGNPRQAYGDLVWALVNGAEFLFRH
ncbi:MAG: DUF1553 domain-containing protein [Spirochaetaceae bacterium]|nr:DUF1553 domain-containing protein [Spirochaetaceae bacterium]